MSLTGMELIHELKEVGLKEINLTVFDTYQQETMGRAQRVLLNNGYHLTASEMIEREVYIQTFVSSAYGQMPHDFTLRYFHDGTLLQLVLALYVGGETGVRVHSDLRTYGTETESAKKIGEDFAYSPIEGIPFWMPAFQGSPFLD